ncbi:MAG: peptidoglycan recognition family protein [bacterium]
MSKASMLIPREAWGASPPDYPVIRVNYKDLFIVHHSGSKGYWPTAAEEIAAMRGWQAYHQGTGADIYYGAVIFPSGRAYEGRQGGWWVNNGAAYGCNQRGFGACIAGDFTDELPTVEALNTLVHLGLEARNELHISPDLYWGHRDCFICDDRNRGNECPGEMLYDWLPVLRKTMATVQPEKEGDDDVIDFEKQSLQEKGQGILADNEVDVWTAFAAGSDYLHARANHGAKCKVMAFAADVSTGNVFGPEVWELGAYAGSIRRLSELVFGTRDSGDYWVSLHMLPDDSACFRGFVRA